MVSYSRAFYPCSLPQTMSSVANASLKHPCPICKTKFPDHKALKVYTGTTSPGSASAHRCILCDRQFCSATALQQHQEAPAHDTMFNCNECKKPFRSKEALKQHQKAKEHRNSKSLVGSVLTADSGPFTIEQSRPQRRSGGTEMRTTVGWKVNSLTGQMMDMQLDEDWALCDKDCGWCGHCAESYSY